LEKSSLGTDEKNSETSGGFSTAKETNRPEKGAESPLLHARAVDFGTERPSSGDKSMWWETNKDLH